MPKEICYKIVDGRLIQKRNIGCLQKSEQMVMATVERASLCFSDMARKCFAFLVEFGFLEVEVSMTLVRYEKNGVEVDVYHGRQSYEMGVDVCAYGSRYSLSEIIRANDPEVAKHFRYPTGTTPEGVSAGLQSLSALMMHYGHAAILRRTAVLFKSQTRATGVG